MSRPNNTCVLALAFAGVASVAGCTGGQAVTAPAQVESSPFSAAIGYDPMLGLWNSQALQTDVAECMQNAGFQYFASNDGDPPAEGLLDLEDAQRGGYGITAAFLVAESEPQSKGQEYESSLSESERSAYESALYGTPDAPGCLVDAQQRFYSSGADGSFPVALDSAISDIRARVASSQAVLDARSAWSRCLSERGYSFNNRNEAQESIRAQVDQLLGTATGSTFTVQLDDSQSAALVAIATKERDLAVADGECDSKVGLFEALQSATSTAQVHFLDEHPGFTLG